MVDISGTTYTPPGVYVSDVTTPTVSPRSVATNTVAIVGPALGYQTATERHAVFTGSAAVLGNTGVYATAVTGPPAIAAPVAVKAADGTALTVGTDYSLTVVAGSGGAATAIVQLKRVSGSAKLVEGDLVQITYNYTNALYYTPQGFEVFSDVVGTYGPDLLTIAPSDPTATQVASPLTLAARVALENGALQVLCLPTNPVDGDFRAQLKAAYAKLETNYSAEILVPLLVDGTYDAHTSSNVANLVADVKAHAETCAAAGYGRIAFVGLAKNYDNVTAHDALAASVLSKRVVLAYPNRMMIFNSSVNASTEVSGYFLGAAMAGRLARNAVNRGLTKQAITSFTGIPAAVEQAMTLAFKNNLSKSGVCVAETNRSGQLTVRHGTTTNRSSLLTGEISIVRIGDTLLQMVQTGLDASGLIGEPITAEMTMTVKATLIGILEQAVSDGVIVSYANLQVRQQSADPSVIEATFDYLPAVPLNYVTVGLSVNLATGDTTSTQ